MTEQEFIENIRANENAIHKLCCTYCENYSREDLVQDIIAEVWKSLSNWKNNCKFSTWLHTIARNVCISRLRKNLKEPSTEELSDYAEVLAVVDNTDELIKQLSDAQRYNTVIDSLNEFDKRLMFMYMYGASYKEISSQVNINENALRRRVNHIKNRLRLRYGNNVIK